MKMAFSKFYRDRGLGGLGASGAPEINGLDASATNEKDTKIHRGSQYRDVDGYPGIIPGSKNPRTKNPEISQIKKSGDFCCLCFKGINYTLRKLNKNIPGYS